MSSSLTEVITVPGRSARFARGRDENGRCAGGGVAGAGLPQIADGAVIETSLPMQAASRPA